MTTVTTITAMKALNPASSPEIYIAGYYNPGDRGGGEFYYDSGSSATPNDGTIFASTYTGTGRWFRVLNGTRVNVRWFGAYGNGSNNDTPALQAAIDYCEANSMGLYVPKGVYIVRAANSGSFALRINSDGFLMEGDGKESEIKEDNSYPYKALLGIQANSGNIKDITVRNLGFDGNRANQSGSWFGACVITVSVSATNSPANITLDGLFCYDAYTDNIGSTGEASGINIAGDDNAYNMTEYYPQNVIVTRCFAWNNTGWGIGSNFANSILVANNVCWNNDTQGISLWNTQDSFVVGNRCYGNASFSINLELCNRITVGDNSVNTANLGIRAFNTLDSVIVGNTIEMDSTYYLHTGILVESGVGAQGTSYKQRPCDNIQISSNMVKSIGSEGMPLKVATDGGYGDNTNIMINDNIITNTVTFKGVEVRGNDITFANNKIAGVVSFDSGGGFMTIDSNDISYFNAPSAFNLLTVNNGSYYVVKGNLFRANQNGVNVIAMTQALLNMVVIDNIWQSSGAFSGGFIGLYGSATSPTQINNASW